MPDVLASLIMMFPLSEQVKFMQGRKPIRLVTPIENNKTVKKVNKGKI